ncbi:YbhB/YbcL family Raf kinase inhibitor-like protein [Fructilactobacillus fructivorans]|uniref:Phospholipid-binding protein n=1 Tax=Fructilactobacillus fructivorans TaxID=1614 RepID=A0A0C1Q2F4_9LACO|nr:YbhB/YbcL family Raf kinase inhibitor-like protein [Fructilactobacillus fructivorans]KID42003.1 Phospholipid-binding protein [Fructilactobacillus fructivorans]KRK57172.1 YbhB YbcL family protein [Fructilactobacillus fructivorans]KRN12115.1 YbhB YbcL family protein [Fructilactobacillus fructivorans]KRN40416.1 YbhB YbcL family protein [Fructilactobacillus fructivorans]KRN42760.1 YbhB YbcL family protein [Fructilactobacillus fructivorans]
MKINTPLQNGFLPDKYTKHAQPDEMLDGHPVISFPIKISDVPSDAKSLVVMLLDDDSIPVCGFTYIHWVAANIDPDVSEIPENASQDRSINMTLGKNSLAGGLVNVTNPKLNQHYVGPTPPDKPHDYQLHVYALDQKLNLSDGFWLNELKQKMSGHIVASAEQILPVKN